MLLVLHAALVLGCASDRAATHRCWTRSSTATTGVVAAEGLAPRGQIHADVSQVGSWREVDRNLASGGRPDHYMQVSPDECRCRAAGYAKAASLLQMERGLTVQLTSGHCAGKQHLAAVQRQLLALRAASRSNEAASQALTAFYELAAAEAACDATDRTLIEVRSMIADHERIKRLTGQSPGDIDALQDREIVVLNQRAEALTTVARLNIQLRNLLAIDAADPRPVWPQADLRPIPQSPDVEGATALALAQRTELQSLRLILGALDRDTLPVARAALGQQDSALGSAIAVRHIRHHELEDREIAVRRQQLAQMLWAAQQSVIDEIHGQVLDVQMRVRDVAAAKHALESRQRDLSRSEAKQAIGAATAFDHAAAQLAVIQAEHELTRRAVDWRIAVVKLHQAQGCLALDCNCEMPPPKPAEQENEVARSVFNLPMTR
ncbi:MAG TPA: hypothetical protein VHY91_03115 [Pirellulales bacterium]|jgi:hypothetical protein|nr:hypothetical protein [Pirellulales bacterium]